MQKLEERVWWNYLHKDLKELLTQSAFLIDSVEKLKKDTSFQKGGFHDYAFVVFPAAKAYEGFLKNVFLDLGFISEDDYYGKRFRVGKALNPALDRRYRKREGVYDKIVEYCNGKELANRAWKTWKEARNLLFHWFPNERNAISFAEAKQKIDLILGTMDLVFADCKIDSKEERK